MRDVAAGVLAIVGLGLMADVAGAQGLGDAAAREAQKRSKASAKKEQPPALTNEDLARGRPPEGYGTAPPPSADAAAADSEPGSTPEASPATGAPRGPDLAPYEAAVKSAEARVKALEARISELGAKLNPMSTTFVYGGGSGLPSEEHDIAEELTEAQDELPQARDDLKKAQDNLSEARLGRPTTPPPAERAKPGRP